MLDMVDDDDCPWSVRTDLLDCDNANGNIPEVVGMPVIIDKLGLISEGSERGRMLLCCLEGLLCDSSCPSCVLARFGGVLLPSPSPLAPASAPPIVIPMSDGVASGKAPCATAPRDPGPALGPLTARILPSWVRR